LTELLGANEIYFELSGEFLGEDDNLCKRLISSVVV
jgi:hypothetical protein